MEVTLETYREIAKETCDDASEQIHKEEGPVAVVGGPFSGRKLLLDHIEESGSDIERITISPGTDELPEIPDDGLVIVEDAHHLYTRSIDGFDLLETFLDVLTASDATIVVSWNAHAWSFLEHVKNIDQLFAASIEPPKLDRSQLAELVSKDEKRRIVFEDDRDVNDKIITWKEKEISFLGVRTIQSPYIDMEAIRSRRTKDDSIEDAIFERIIDRSGGNLGTAVTMWERSLVENTIRFGTLLSPPSDLDIREHDAEVLFRLVHNEKMRREQLSDLVGPLERSLSVLERHGLVEGGEVVRLDAVAVPAIIDELGRRRLIW